MRLARGHALAWGSAGRPAIAARRSARWRLAPGRLRERFVGTLRVSGLAVNYGRVREGFVATPRLSGLAVG